MKNRMNGIHFNGLVFAPDRAGDGGVDVEQALMDDIAPDEQFDMLMSLALDDMLTPEEESRFNSLMVDEQAYDDAWDKWQFFDSEFRAAPDVEPPADFVASVETRLLKRQRRRRIWMGVGIGLVVLALWGSLVAGLVGAGAYVVFNQSDWITSVVRFIVLTSATVQSQVSMILSSLNSALSTSQVQVMVLAYVGFGMIVMWVWAKFLRRSLAESDAVAALVS